MRLSRALAQALLERISARRAKESFAEFVRQAIAAGVVGGVTQLEWAKHLDAICDETQAMLEGWLVANGHGTPAMIERQAAHWRRHYEGTTILGEPWLREPLVQNWLANLPPGTLKSSVVLVLGNAWVWLHAPGFRFGAASYNERNVERDSLATRDVVTSAWYRETFGIEWTIRRDADSVGKWATTAGGERLSRTIGAGFTGLHLDGLFIDDPDDADKVWNEPERRRVQGRFTRAIENRVNDERRSIRMVLQQRVHVEDLTGYLLTIARWSTSNRKGWAWLCIPMEFGRCPDDAPKVTPFGWQDWRTVVGEIMHPARFPADVLADKREKLGSNGYEGQYNQNPRPIDGGMVSRSWLRFWVPEGTNLAHLRRRPLGCLTRDELPPVEVPCDDKNRPKFDELLLSIDCSNGGEAATASAVGIMGYARRGEDRFVFDDATAVLGILEMLAAVKTSIVRWRSRRVLIELKAAGASLVAELKRALAAGEIRDDAGTVIPVVVEVVKVVKDSKVGRFKACVPSFEQGRWHFLDGAPWLYERGADEGCIAEVCGFPASRRNDRIDALSQADAKYRDQARRPSPVGGKRGVV